MNFKQLADANATIKTTDIRGKQYAEVNQRIKAFRMVCPNGSIITEIVKLEDGFCLMRAQVIDNTPEGMVVLATGTAYERENSSNINKTSYIENCETSAIGRALGVAGFGIDTSVASAEEVQNAIAQQEGDKPSEAEQLKAKPIDEAKIAALTAALTQNEVPIEKVLKLYKVESLADLTLAKWNNAMQHIEDLKKA